MPDMNYAAMPDLLTMGLRRLGPAMVTAVAGGMLEVAAEGRCVMATLAVPGIYTPVAGDTVLVIEAGDAAYVIGVLQATGPMTICAPGDLRLVAPNGSVMLEGSTVTATAGEIHLTAGQMWLNADRLREGFRTVQRVVSETLDLEVGDLRARVSETFSLLAKRVRAAATEDVKIDGKRIHLG